MAERGDFHPSHDLFMDYERGQDPHWPLWACRTCDETACEGCPAEPGDELTEPCAGFPWYEGVTARAGNGEAIRARRSGTGWPKLRAASPDSAAP